METLDAKLVDLYDTLARETKMDVLFWTPFGSEAWQAQPGRAVHWFLAQITTTHKKYGFWKMNQAIPYVIVEGGPMDYPLTLVRKIEDAYADSISASRKSRALTK